MPVKRGAGRRRATRLTRPGEAHDEVWRPAGGGPIARLPDAARKPGFAVVDFYAADAGRLPFPPAEQGRPRYDELSFIDKAAANAAVELLIAARRLVAERELQHKKLQTIGGSALQPLQLARKVLVQIEGFICGPLTFIEDDRPTTVDDPATVPTARARGRKRLSEASDRIVAALVSFPYSAGERREIGMRKYSFEVREISSIMSERYGIRITPNEVSKTVNRIVAADGKRAQQDRWLPYFTRPGRGEVQRQQRLARNKSA